MKSWDPNFGVRNWELKYGNLYLNKKSFRNSSSMYISDYAITAWRRTLSS